MLKRATLAAAVAALLALAATVPAVRAADRTYTLCDPMKSRMCASLVAYYMFEEASNYDRTSETGSKSWLEPPSLDAARSTVNYADGAASLDLVPVDNPSTAHHLSMPRSSSLGGSFTMNFWIKFSATPSTYSAIYTVDLNGAAKGSYLHLEVSGSNFSPRFVVKQEMTDTATYVQTAQPASCSAWHFVSFGMYPSPTTSEPFQNTIWVALDAGTRATATIAYPPQVFLGDLYLVASNAAHTYVDAMSVFSGSLSPGELTWLKNNPGFPFTANP